MRSATAAATRGNARRPKGALLAIASMLLGLVPLVAIETGAAAAAGAGTNIGNAKHLTGGASGSLASRLADDWYVVYPSSPGGTMTIKVADTTATSSSCDGLDFAFRDDDGNAIVNAGLVPNSTYETPFSSPNSDRYFVELTTAGCDPPSGPVTYSLTVQSGGGGTAPSPSSGSIAAGTSIGKAWPPLQGDTSYKGTIGSDISDDWYQLFKHAGTAPATIRVENTTVKGSTDCTNLSVAFRNTDGNAISNVGLADNTAHTFSIAASDRYYLELTDNGCTNGDTTYRIEPEGAGSWDNPAKVPTGTAAPGTSIGNPWPPLKGKTSYNGTVASGVSDNWYVLFKHAGTAPATIRVENTTVKGSTDCTNLSVAFRNTDGNAISNVGLADNTAHTFSIAASDRYYLELTDNGCTNGDTTYRIEPEGTGSWDSPAKLPTKPMLTGPSRAQAGGPLSGGITYTATIPKSTTQLWAEVDTNGKVPVVTISGQNTTNNQANCRNVAIALVRKDGSVVSNVGLSDNTGHEFTIDTAGKFFLEITDNGCTPSGTKRPTVGVTITPPKGVNGGTGDGRVPANQLHTSAAGQAFIKDYEKGPGDLFHPYNDSGGHCTVGWGHLLHLAGCTAKERNTKYTQAQIDGFWTHDLATAESRLKGSIGTVPLLQQEFDALSSFVFNLGAICGTGFETICADLRANPPNYTKVAKDLMLYDHDSSHHVVCGLYRRRLDEGQIWSSGSYTRDFPKCPKGSLASHEPNGPFTRR